MAEVEIGIYKSARQAYGFDDIAIVPSRRTRDPEDVDISWQIDAYKFDLPVLGSAMDGAMSPDTAIELGRLGGLGVLNLEVSGPVTRTRCRSSKRSANSTTTRRRPGCNRCTWSRSRSNWSPSASLR